MLVLKNITISETMEIKSSTIALRKQTIEKIMQLGRKGDTYDKIINKLLEQES